MSDLMVAFAEFNSKKPIYEHLFAYYEGKQPTRYATEKLNETFGKLAHFTQNWCGLVVDSVVERVTLRKYEVVGDIEATERLNELLEGTGLNQEYDDITRALLITGEAFVVMGREEAPPVPPPSQGDGGGQRVEAYYNDPRLVMAHYDPERPRRMDFAAKIWMGKKMDGEDVKEEKVWHLLLYYADHFEHYQTERKDWPSTAEGFIEVDEEQKNEFGEIPVVHFRLPKSELNSIIPIQDEINKLNADMMVTSEFAGMPQRYVMTEADDIGALKNRPNEIWKLPEESKAGQFDTADLDGYLKAIEQNINAISAISRTPKHFFFAATSNISGDALIAMEAPQVKKCETIIAAVRPAWKQVGVMLMRLGGGRFKEGAITPMFGEVATVQPTADADTLIKTVDAGIPLITALRKRGWTNDELKQLREDIEEAGKLKKKTLGQALTDSQREFDRG